MTEWAARRFWTDVRIVEEAGGFGLRLDDKPVRTPGKRELTLPTLAVAERVAAEWAAQEGVIDPRSMPWTRSSNSAVEKVGPQRAEVEAHLKGYAASDLVCYRAEGPEGLIERQEAAWEPLLDWLATRFDVRLVTTRGVMPVEQPPAAVSRLAKAMAPMSDFELTGFYDLVTLPGSFALALAVAEGRLDVRHAWDISRIDETWQEEQWGADEEAAEVAARRRAAFAHAAEFYAASGA